MGTFVGRTPDTEALAKAMADASPGPRDDLVEALTITDRILMPLSWSHVRTLALMLVYGNEHYGRGKKTPMNVEKMANLWADNIAQLSLSHDKESRDRADFEADEILAPLLIAPVAQLREFASTLATVLKEDHRIPWLVWSTFEQWVSHLVKMDDKGTIQLKTDLALEVAKLAETGLSSEDWILAIMNALQWRSTGSLQAIKKELETGSKPKLRGRESCLFLEVGNVMVEL